MRGDIKGTKGMDMERRNEIANTVMTAFLKKCEEGPEDLNEAMRRNEEIRKKGRGKENK